MDVKGKQSVRTIARIKRGDFLNQLIFRIRNRASIASPDAAFINIGGLSRPTLARVNQAVDLHSIRAELLSFLTTSLAQAGISHRLVHHTQAPHIRIVIAQDSAHTFARLAAAKLPHPHWELRSSGPQSWELAAHIADPQGHVLSDSRSAVGIEVWESPQSHQRPDDGIWPPGAIAPEQTAGYNTPFLVLDDEEFSTNCSPFFAFEHPIDVVYTWVDASDPAWNERRISALATLDDSLHPAAVDAARYESFDELKYSLRSVFTYANWIRKIHIVTDQQTPAWLDTSHPKINIVDHREILPAPVFNSHAIESHLHHIPGLSEHYLYLNDDVFFGAMAYPQDFFASEMVAKFFPSDLPLDPRPALPQDPPIMAAAKNGRDLLRQRFSHRVQQKLRHSVHPQLRSVVTALEHEFPAAFDQVSRSTFRSATDISVAASMAHWYGYLIGRAVPSELEYLYLNLNQPDTGKTLDALYSLRRYQTFCLNQERHTTATGSGISEMAQFLPRYFPYAAPWEK